MGALYKQTLASHSAQHLITSQRTHLSSPSLGHYVFSIQIRRDHTTLRLTFREHYRECQDDAGKSFCIYQNT